MNKNNITPQWGEDRAVEFVKQLRRRGVTGEQVQVAIEEKGGAILDTIVISLTRVPSAQVSPPYEVLVNYDLCFEDAIREVGFDAYVEYGISAPRFPNGRAGQGEQRVTIELVQFNKVVTDDVVTEELAKRGLRDATLRELLALCAKFNNLARAFPIVARGSVWHHGIDSVAFAGSFDGKRYLRLKDLDKEWDAHFGFVAVRK